MRKTKNAAGFTSPAALEQLQADYTIKSAESKEEIHRIPIRFQQLVDLSVIRKFPAELHQLKCNIPTELLTQPRWFSMRPNKIAYSGWNLPENQLLFDKVRGCRGFDISGHGNYPEYLVLDWDKVYNPGTNTWVNDFAYYVFKWVVSSLPVTYIESSISRQGFHMVIRPTSKLSIEKITNASKNVLYFTDTAKLEIYYKNKSKYLVFTGYQVSSASNVATGDEVDEFISRLMKEIHLFNGITSPTSVETETPVFTMEQNRVRATKMIDYIPIKQLSRADWRTVIRCWRDLELPIEIVREWSKNDSRYNDGKDASFQETWDNMEPGDPTIAIKTLCNWAERYGNYNSVDHMDQKLWQQFNIDDKVAQLSSILYYITNHSPKKSKELSISTIKQFLESNSSQLTTDVGYSLGFCSQYDDPEIVTLLSQAKTRCKQLGIAAPNFNKLIKSYQKRIKQAITKKQVAAIQVPTELLPVDSFDLQQVIWPDNLIPNWKRHTLDRITPEGTEIAFDSIMLITESLIEIGSNNHYVTIAVLNNSSNNWKFITTSRDIVANNSKIINLAKQGLLVRSKSAGAIVEFLGEFERQNAKLIPQKTLVFQPGWYGDEFILSNNRSDNYTLDPSASTKLQLMFSCAGDKTKILPLIQRVKSIPVANVALGTLLAGPLVRVIGIDNIQVHLYGAAGSGKSMLNKLLYSLLGNPYDLVAIPSANATVAALEFHFASHRDLPILIEDINTVTDEASRDIIQQLIMCFGNGTGKMRGNTEFTVSRINELYGSLLTNAEKLMTQYNSNSGSKRRVIELIVPGDLITPDFAEEIINVIKDNYGGFLDSYISSIQSNKAAIKQLYKTIYSQFKSMVTDKVPRHLQSIAAITTANVWFDKLVLSPETSLESSTGTEIESVAEILQQLPSTEEISDIARVKILIKEWIQQNHMKFAAPRDYDNSDNYGIETNRYVAVDPQLFKRLLNNHGFPVETIIQQLQLQLDGFLTKGDGNNLFSQIKLSSNKKIRMAKIEKSNLK